MKRDGKKGFVGGGGWEGGGFFGRGGKIGERNYVGFNCMGSFVFCLLKSGVVGGERGGGGERR